MEMQIAQRPLLQYSNECPIIEEAIQEYTMMKADLSKETNDEICFNIARDYWGSLKERIAGYVFDSKK